MSQLKQKISLTGLTLMAVGACIGSGIFVTPAQIAAEVTDTSLILAVWLLGGIVALTGALTFSELGGLFPKSGGVYVYLREAYGDWVGFLYGWVTLLVINTGALAGLCVAFAEYMTIFIPGMQEVHKMGLAAGTMLGLTALNVLGVEMSQRLSNVFTGLKLVAIAGLIIAGFWMYNPTVHPFTLSAPSTPASSWLGGILTALVGVLFSMGGWHHASYLSGETINPQKNVPRAMFLGVLIVTLVYLLVNIAYLLLLPTETIAHSSRVAADAMAVVGTWGPPAVSVAIAISIFGTISIYTMSAPRVYFAMAQDGLFFKQLAYVHPRWRTPVVAMGVQVVWALLVVLFFRGVFDQIITFVTFMDIVFMALAGIALFIFRKKRPEAERPIFAWGYPVVPILFIVISLAFSVNVLLEKPAQALPGVGLLLLGMLVYWRFWRKPITG
jgi:APA family basic amino acid/polyamine antiporter